MSPSSKGDKGSTKKGSTRVSGYSGKVRIPRPAEEPKWQVDADFKPPRKISDKELEAARKMFFELDRDGSGSIDAEELGLMLRSLGQNPSDEELHALIDSVDTGDKDGQVSERSRSGSIRAFVSQSLDDFHCATLVLACTRAPPARSHTPRPASAALLLC